MGRPTTNVLLSKLAAASKLPNYWIGISILQAGKNTVQTGEDPLWESILDNQTQPQK